MEKTLISRDIEKDIQNIEDEIRLLTTESKEAEKNEDWDTYYTKIVEIANNKNNLGNIYLNFGASIGDNLDYLNAGNLFRMANTMNVSAQESLNNIIHKINKTENEKLYGKITKLSKKIDEHIIGSEAYYNFSLGQEYRFSSRSTNAKEHFKKAKNKFNIMYEKTGDCINDILSHVSDNLIIVSDALGNFNRGNYSEAKMLYQRAMIKSQVLKDEILPGYFSDGELKKKDYEFYIKLQVIDSASVEIRYYLSYAEEQLKSKNYNHAIDQFNKLLNIYQEEIEPNLDFFPKNHKFLHMGDKQCYISRKYFAQSELLRDQEKWDESIKFYNKASEELNKASGYYLKSGLPQATIIQESIERTSIELIETSINQCLKEKELNKKINRLEKDKKELWERITKSLESGGVTVNTKNEVIATLSQNVDIINKFENRVRDNVKNIVKELDKSESDNIELKDIKDKAVDIIQSTEHGYQFIEKVKKFITYLDEKAKILEENAKPFLPLLNAIKLLL